MTLAWRFAAPPPRSPLPCWRMERDLRSGRFVAWGNAVLAGLVSPDTAAERICGRDRHHRVACARIAAGGLGPGESTGADGGASLPIVLAGLRAGGVRGLQLALPTPGDPLGLPGPPSFNESATLAGEAVAHRRGQPARPRPRGASPSVRTARAASRSSGTCTR